MSEKLEQYIDKLLSDTQAKRIAISYAPMDREAWGILAIDRDYLQCLRVGTSLDGVTKAIVEAMNRS